MPIPMRQVFQEAREFFMGESNVQKAAEKVCRYLEDMKIPYALCDGLAVNRYGLKRMTEYVDILLTREGLEQFKQRWLGAGWVERFPGSKGLKDPENKVRIDVLLTGEIPGDGKTAPFGFPDPGTVSQADEDGIRVLSLAGLIQLKLASGMTSPHRLQDFADVLRLIEANKLPRDYAVKMHEYVRVKYDELWQAAQTVDPQEEA
ncbi:MAG: hypothetical protein IT464_16415 [Planctomycetes bacterium]|nr:hypothetical protein [Planctomycetota bacterium]